jgi:hypothetical protein
LGHLSKFSSNFEMSGTAGQVTAGKHAAPVPSL